MNTQSSDSNATYCPSCFRVAEDQRVFCFFCGQFIHEHVPTDSRLWDSRLSDLAVLEPPPSEQPPTIQIPDDFLNLQQNPSNATVLRGNDNSNTADTDTDFDNPDQGTVKDPESEAATHSKEASPNDPIVGETIGIEKDEESRQDHQATT